MKKNMGLVLVNYNNAMIKLANDETGANLIENP